jgi:hypothetical protein
MICEQPNISETGRYQIMLASRLMQMDRRTLLKYADYFKVAPKMNKVSNRPYFTGKQLLKIWYGIN